MPTGKDLVLSTIGVVVLAAGKGTRLKHTTGPKVMAEIGGRPMIHYTIETLQQLGFSPQHICLVVNFQKERLMKYLGATVSYAFQEELLGTAHAAYAGMRALPLSVTDVLVLGGDDSAFYRPETLQSLMHIHLVEKPVLTLLTALADNPAALGRIIRHPDGRVEIIEKEYLTAEQTLIKEISTGTFVFNRAWFEAMFLTMPKLRKLGEYGLPTALAMAHAEHQPYRLMQLPDNSEWFGVNTPEQLAEADRRKRMEKN